jgi:flagellin-like hook-associated protein FlgL
MVSRISTLASNTQLVNILLATQKRLRESEVQVSSEKVSETYLGLARDAERLIGLENKSVLLERFKRNNEIAQLKVDTTGSSLDIIRQAINDFQKDLQNFQTGTTTGQDEVAQVQDSAIQSLQVIQGYLNTQVAGDYIYSGSRTAVPPVDFGTLNKAAFQAKFDGTTIIVPQTRTDNLAFKLTAATGYAQNANGAGYGSLAFADANPDTITATTVGAFAYLPVGTSISIGGATAAGNNGTFTIAANTGTVITLAATDTLTTDAADAGATLVADTSYYKGDPVVNTHRLDESRSFNLDLNASDPAFEKAMRAMQIIAQGVFGTAGGLDMNNARVTDALYLLGSSQLGAVNGTAPYGTELLSNFDAIDVDNGYKQVLIDRANANHTASIGILDTRVGEIEDVDLLEAITRVTTDARVLEASYQVLARTRSLGLQDFLQSR